MNWRQKVRRYFRRKERGQSIILIALGFIFLMLFVGLTTDIAVMFVRYSTLRRAVDSAAIAAANQMREDRSIATVSLAARQFVEFHGLDGARVSVDTCQTFDWAIFPELAEELQCLTEQRKLVRVVAQVDNPPIFFRFLSRLPGDWSDLTNITLQASAISETAVLDVVVIMDVSESMLEDTTIEDWANIGYGQVYLPPNMDRILPQLQASGDYGYTAATTNEEHWNFHLGRPQKEINDRLWYEDDPGNLNAADANAIYNVKSVALPGSAGTQNHPRTQCRVRFYPLSSQLPIGNWQAYTDASGNMVNLNELYAELGNPGPKFENDEYKNRFSSIAWSGFVPSYNFYGCCNDPMAGAEVVVNDAGNLVLQAIPGETIDDQIQDFKFNDLICQPFRGARDATFDFLQRIDFFRGDRVAFVTFDRTAYLINPYSTDARIEGRSHMIDNLEEAVDTLQGLVGVRGEANFYSFNPGDIGDGSELITEWDGYAAGINANGQSRPLDFDRVDTFNPENDNPDDYTHYFQYPAFRSCAFDNAVHPIGAHTLFDQLPSTPPDEGGFPSMLYVMNPPSSGDPEWDPFWSSQQPVPGYTYDQLPPFKLKASYEQWAGCRGTNIGAALRQANNALLDPNTSRRFGTVWVMVMLGDGAAGASDPVRRNREKLSETQPYVVNPAGITAENPTGFGIRGEYGAFGLCPYGTSGFNGTAQIRGEVVRGADDPPRGFEFPFCSDESAMTRHSCDFRPAVIDDNPTAMQDNDYETIGSIDPALIDNDPNTTPIDFPELMHGVDDELAWNIRQGNLYDVDIGTANCSVLYDVDDYARDWADVIALERYNSGGDALLPTIFTIGFGLTFDNGGSPGTCADNIGDCLGEQMLRYIADAGDNNRIDNDFFQDYLSDENWAIRSIDNDFGGDKGSRGRCQTDVVIGNYEMDGVQGIGQEEAEIMYEPLPPTESCGNYFNAPDAEELQFVFDIIASRMFTRLAE